MTVPRDELLCYCEEVPHAEFAAAVAANPDFTFDAACAAARVGMRCTACLLNAERYYIEALAAAAGGPSAKPRGGRRMFPARRDLYAWLDRHAPRVRPRNRTNVPVLGGSGVQTVVSVANSVTAEVAGQPATVTATLEFRDAEGRVRDRIRQELPPGARLDRDAAAAVDSSDGLSVGTCWVELVALNDGYNGALRPHFRVLTPGAVSSLHSQGPGRRVARHTTIRANAAERQYVALMNVNGRAAAARITITPEGGSTRIWEGAASVPPMGARLVELPQAPGDAAGAPVHVETESDQPLRCHFVVSSEDHRRISFDHI